MGKYVNVNPAAVTAQTGKLAAAGDDLGDAAKSYLSKIQNLETELFKESSCEFVASIKSSYPDNTSEICDSVGKFGAELKRLSGAVREAMDLYEDAELINENSIKKN